MVCENAEFETYKQINETKRIWRKENIDRGSGKQCL